MSMMNSEEKKWLIKDCQLKFVVKYFIKKKHYKKVYRQKNKIKYNKFDTYWWKLSMICKKVILIVCQSKNQYKLN